MNARNTVIAVIVIAILAIAGIGAYALTLSGTTSTVTTTVAGTTVTQTITGGGTGGATQTVTQTITTTATAIANAQVNQTLVTLSQKEGGAVTCYCVMDTSDWPTINTILIKQFPWVKMNYVGLSPGDIVTRAKTEYQAGHVQGDFIIDSAPDVETLVPIGALQQYTPPAALMNNISGIDPQGYLIPNFALTVGLCWNTNLVTNNATLPTTYLGLSNPIWKNKIVIDDPSTLNLVGPLFATFGGSVNNQSFVNWLNAFKANNPVFAASAGDVYTDVSTGQYAIGLCYSNDYLSGISSGAPVGFENLGGAYYSPVDSALLTGAPHPYTAELLINWFDSYSGAVALSLTGRTPLISSVAAQYFGNIIPPGTALIEMAGNTNMYTNGTQWINLYTSIFGP